ncbi:DUF3857 domain-containing protein [Christiangramia sabulilitoris]|uniref:DUF3857 domain-containing protein n=1 Tax=Christiangramia sabulilitoris TaxID=2583991 RepID=A0A550HZC2_9FLAO|nr:DUF3857 domain-containing protein [Christiangramia sabulilitoris]TRO64076.1 DUF3857 domain-containing protein [Christiangramia sabulilitoris]
MSRNFIIICLLFFCFQHGNSQNYKFGKVSKKEVLQKEHPIKKDADAAVLYRSQNVYYDLDKNDGFILITEVHERIKIYNKEGFEWANKKISRYNGSSDEEKIYYLKGITYNMVDGKLEEEKLRKDEIFEEESSKYWRITSFTMPAVKEGSVIEYIYKIRSPYLGSIGRTPLQYTIPIDKLEVDVTIPEYFYFSKYQNLRSSLVIDIQEERKNAKYNFSSFNRETNSFGVIVSNTTSNNVVEYVNLKYSVNKENIPALKQESYVEHLHNYAAFLDWELQYTKFPNSTVKNYSESWEGVAKSIYYDLGIGNDLSRDNYYDEELDQLLAGISDPLMKTNKIFNFLKQKVKWNGNAGYYPDNGLKKAFKEGSGNIGDINLLLISMLKYANLNANPVLVSTPSNGVPLYPTRDGFNYVIAGLQIGQSIYLLDATDPFAGIGELPKRARNWQGRLIRDDKTSLWINLMPTYQSQTAVSMNIKITDAGAEGIERKLYTGLFAKEFRGDHYMPEPDNGIAKRWPNFEDLEISDYTSENDKDLGAELIENFDFKIPSATSVIGDKIYFQPLLFEGLQENPFKDDERIYPILFDFPESKIHTVNILLPDGYEISSLPESIHFSLGKDVGEFKFIVNGAGNTIRISSLISLKKSAFQAEEYDLLKKFYSNIIKKHSEAIVLEKTLEDGHSERAESGR